MKDNIIFWFIIGILLGHLAISCARAEQRDHDAAHFGVSYALNTFEYGFWNTVGLTQNDSMWMAGGAVLMVGASYEMLDNATGPKMVRSMAFNALGVALSDLTLWMFHLKNDETTPEVYIGATTIGFKVPLQ